MPVGRGPWRGQRQNMLLIDLYASDHDDQSVWHRLSNGVGPAEWYQPLIDPGRGVKSLDDVGKV